ncbi:hypothetical protein FRC00_013150 [Tulasnella sp. 408]|nr:hypothetical protein FRC00_013150 [Tulasnella sp. 408]
MSAGSLTLGGNLSLAVGPLGRNGEAMGALNTKGKVAAMYSYSKTKGLFGGVSIEGSIIVERQDANAIAYQSDVTAKQLLSGTIPPPHWADGLIQILTQTVGEPIPGWVDDEPMSASSDRPSMSGRSSEYSFQGIGSTSNRSSEGVFARGHKKAMSLNPFNKKPASNGFDGGSRELPDDDRYTGRSSMGASSRRDWSPPRSAPAPPKPAAPAFDGFADDEDDNPWKTPPGFAPQPTSTSTSTSWYPRTQVPPVSATSTSWYPNSRSPSRQTTPSATSGSIFPTHFESDFVPEAPPPSSTPSRSFTPSYPQPQPNSGPPPYTNSGTPFREEPKSLRGMGNPSPVGQTWSDQDPFSGLGTATFDQKRGNTPPPPSQSPMSNKPTRKLSVKRGLDGPAPPGTVKAIAMFDYTATEAGDLSFREGDVIYVTEKTESTNDWWTGRLAAQPSQTGIFPANFVELAS